MKRKIYNLEFPSWCPEVTVFGYKFLRVEDYEEKVKRLQHLVSRISEYEIKQNTGGHSLTAYVEHPEPEKSAVFQWKNENSIVLQNF